MSEPTVRPGAELELAARVVELVRRAAGPGAEAEVMVQHDAVALTRFALSMIHQNVADATTTVHLLLHLDGRTATASPTILLPDCLRWLLERTLPATRRIPPATACPALTPPAPRLTSALSHRTR